MNEVQNPKLSPCCQAPYQTLRSFNYRRCYDCGLKYEYPLKEGQPPLIKAQR